MSGKDRAALLNAFDRAGVGREPLSEETSERPDDPRRPASTAGAVSATVLDSPTSGLGALRPVTRLVRGAMLVLHWMIVALTSRGVVPRMLALLGLSVGSILLTASLLGALPGAWSGRRDPVRCVVRARGLLVRCLAHGDVAARAGAAEPARAPVDLCPVAGTAGRGRWGGRGRGAGWCHVGRDDPRRDRAARARGLPASYGSVWLALGSLADRRGVRTRTRPGVGWSPASSSGLCDARGVWIRSLPGLIGPAVVIALPVALAWWLVDTGAAAIADALLDRRWWLVGLAVVCVVAGGIAAFVLGDLLRPATRVRHPGAQSLTGEYGPLTNPAGINASWAVLYGAGYFTIAIVVLSTAVERGDTRVAGGAGRHGDRARRGAGAALPGARPAGGVAVDGAPRGGA